MNYYLGVDIGTTSSKAVAFSKTGEVIESFSVSYEMLHPHPDESELDVEEVFKAVISVINTVVAKSAPHKPAFISFSAAMHSLIAIDKNENLLTQCIIWADNRADEIANDLKNSSTGFSIYQTTGVPIHSMSPLCKLLWFQKHNIQIFEKASKFIGIKEFIFYRLFKKFVVDTSVASATGLLNSTTLQWEKSILDLVKITPHYLSEVVSVKQAFIYKNQFAGLVLPDDVPFVIGSSDGGLSNLGTGATGPNVMAITIGTSGAARLVVSGSQTDSKMRTFCYHLKDNLYIFGGANNNGAVVLQWLKETLLQANDDYKAFFEEAETVAPGSEGLIFLPYLLGERAPVWNSNAKGVFFGLTIQHTKAHLIRASMEAVIFSMYSIGKILAENKNITELQASGGFAKNDLWLQMLADVFNIKVLLSGALESAALGAVMLGFEALSIQYNFQQKVLASFKPDIENHKIYQKNFQRFERLYQLLKDEMTGDEENI